MRSADASTKKKGPAQKRIKGILWLSGSANGTSWGAKKMYPHCVGGKKSVREKDPPKDVPMRLSNQGTEAHQR